MSYIRKRLKGIEDCFRIDPGINVPFILLEIYFKYEIIPAVKQTNLKKDNGMLHLLTTFESLYKSS